MWSETKLVPSALPDLVRPNASDTTSGEIIIEARSCARARAAPSRRPARIESRDFAAAIAAEHRAFLVRKKALKFEPI